MIELHPEKLSSGRCLTLIASGRNFPEPNALSSLPTLGNSFLPTLVVTEETTKHSGKFRPEAIRVKHLPELNFSGCNSIISFTLSGIRVLSMSYARALHGDSAGSAFKRTEKSGDARACQCYSRTNVA